MSDKDQPKDQKNQQPQEETFLFDDFFASDEQRTTVVPVTILGRTVPITVKAGISVEDRMSSQRAAVKRLVKPDGSITVLGVDEGEAAIELLCRVIVDWPFVTKSGEKVAVTKDHIRKLLGGADELASAIKTIDEKGVAALGPFAPPSDEA